MNRAVMIVVGCLLSIATSFGQTLTSIVPDGKPHKFEARNHNFYIDGEPTMLLAGEMHFGRVVPEFWDHRLKQARAMGLNAVSMYLFWNQAEPRDGEFAFTGFNDVRTFIQLAQANGLWVILRPGPYCCAETEFGGIPWWLLKDREMRIRSNDPKFIKYAKRYIEKVAEQVKDLQVSHGGPLVMVQMDNEYGRVDDYMRSLHTIFKDAGFDCQLFTCDHTRAQTWRTTDLLPGVMHCRNGLRNDEMFQQSAATIGDFPVFSPEVYTAWYSVWGGERATKSVEDQIKWTSYMLDHNYSFCLYMFHGGTNFGFSNGSNGARPIQTSYDYDAPVDEAGRVTPKFHAMRELIAKRFNRTLPEIPADPKMIEIPRIALTEHCPLIETLTTPGIRTSGGAYSMEHLDQGYGFVLYRTASREGLHARLDLRRTLDYSIVMVNGKTVGRSFAGYGPASSQVAIDSQGQTTLHVLAYNLGRTSSPFNQSSGHKAYMQPLLLPGVGVMGWEAHPLPLDQPPEFKASNAAHTGPTFYRGSFDLSEVGETFLDLRNWSFGVVWVNGHNLGRFWDRGSLRSLYLPSVWQKVGKNEIVILELHDAPKSATVAGVTQLIHEAPKSFGFEGTARQRRPATTQSN